MKKHISIGYLITLFILLSPQAAMGEISILSFFQVDENKDMLINRKEFSGKIQGLAFIPFDSNHDTVIDFSEWKELVVKVQGPEFHYELDEGVDERKGVIEVKNGKTRVMNPGEFAANSENFKQLFIPVGEGSVRKPNENDQTGAQSGALVRIFSYDF